MPLPSLRVGAREQHTRKTPYDQGVLDVLAGFTTIWVVIGIGILVAHLGLFDDSSRRQFSQLAFYVGLPALLFMALARADLARIFSTNVIVSLIAIFLSAVVYLLAASLIWHRGISHKIIGTFCSCYVNANNMGLPIAAYVMKDTSWVAPILLIQMIFLQPLGLALLDINHAKKTGRPNSLRHNLTTPLRNPLTMGVLAGLLVNLLGWQLPQLLTETLDLLGGLSVPCMLIAFGISLRLGSLPGRTDSAETIFASLIKLIFQPLMAFIFAHVFGLDTATTLAVVVMAGLPTAQNVFVFSSRYDTDVALARDVIFITTVASIPTITAFAAIIHAIS